MKMKTINKKKKIKCNINYKKVSKITYRFKARKKKRHSAVLHAKDKNKLKRVQQ